MSLTDKASYKRELAKLQRKMKKVVDWSCNTAELERDDLILDLHNLAMQAIDSLPSPGEAIIRWQAEDVIEKASDIGLRLGKKAAQAILEEISDSLEDTGIEHGWDVIEDRLYEERAERRNRKKAV